MKSKQTLLASAERTAEIVRCEIDRVCDEGVVVFGREGETVEQTFCNVLQTSEDPSFHLMPGDTVLVWLPEGDEERGVVLGRIGPSRVSAVKPEKTQDTPDELVIEAKNNLTFKCGDGSITLRKDGKILIKGKDLVSRAKRMNRIKGGSVAIN